MNAGTDVARRDAFQGNATADSPLREIFPTGLVPITSPRSQLAVLGEVKEPQEVYFIAVNACTAEQREGMAQLMCRMGQGPIEAARAAVATGEHIPVRARNFTGVSFPLRYVL